MDKHEIDEMAELARMAESMGDEAPVIEQETSQAPAAPTPQPAVPDQDDVAGGLDGGELELDDAPAPNILDEFLGGAPKREAPKEEQRAAPEPKAEQQSGLDERLKELAEDRKRLMQQNEQLVSRLLSGEKKPELDGRVEESWQPDPEVSNYFKPYIRQEAEAMLKEMGIDELKAAVKPIQEQSKEKAMATEISRHVEGFKPEYMSKVREAYMALPENEQALYGDSVAGAILLAQNLVSRGALDVGQKRQTNPLARRHRSEITGDGPEGASSNDENEKIRRLMSLPDDQFARALDELTG